MASMTPRAGSSGVVRTFAVRAARDPDALFSHANKSVNVPPTSTPTRNVIQLSCLLGPELRTAHGSRSMMISVGTFQNSMDERLQVRQYDWHRRRDALLILQYEKRFQP